MGWLLGALAIAFAFIVWLIKRPGSNAYQAIKWHDEQKTKGRH